MLLRQNTFSTNYYELMLIITVFILEHLFNVFFYLFIELLKNIYISVK